MCIAVLFYVTYGLFRLKQRCVNYVLEELDDCTLILDVHLNLVIILLFFAAVLEYGFDETEPRLLGLANTLQEPTLDVRPVDDDDMENPPPDSGEQSSFFM